MAAVETIHEEYKKNQEKWLLLRDCYDGQYAVHAAGERYLPKLGGQSADDYQKYKRRATFHNATRRTIQAMNGMLFRKEALINTSADISAYIDNVDLNGTSLHTFAQKCAKEIITVNRAIVLVEFNNYQDVAPTIAQAEAQNRRPYLCLYPAESLVNWRTSNINGQEVLTLAVIREAHTVDVNDFEGEIVYKYRVLTLENNRYIQRIWSQIGEKKQYQVESEIMPLKLGRPMAYIPLYIYGVQGQEITPDLPPLMDLATLNISHYMTSADLEHGAHYAGLPTAVISGHTPSDGQTFSIGSQTAWVFGDAAAKATYLEFTGQGLQALETRLEKKEQQMAAQGARMLVADKKVAEAAETETIRRSGELSILAAIALSVSELITQVMRELLEWQGLNIKFEYQVNRDFAPSSMTAQELTAWVSALQSGAVSQQTFFEALQSGEMVKDALTFEEEQDRRETQELMPTENDLPPVVSTAQARENQEPIDLQPIVDAINSIKIEVPAQTQQTPDMGVLQREALAAQERMTAMLAKAIAPSDVSMTDADMNGGQSPLIDVFEKLAFAISENSKATVKAIQDGNKAVIDSNAQIAEALTKPKKIEYDAQGRIKGVK